MRPLVAVLVVLLPQLAAAQPAPRLMFTDIESGPGTGGQNGQGAFVSIYGEGFGAAQGGSTVTIGGQPVASVTSWGQDNAPRGLDRIVVQPGPGAVSGDIVVTVGGQASNGLPFTVRPGGIYFVDQASGSDGNPGTFAQPWATLWRPRQTLVAGDIVYVIGGTFIQLDPDYPGWDTLLFLDTALGASGTAAAPIAYLGYPGNPPLLENIAARRGIYLNQDSGPLSYMVIGNIRFGLMEDAINVNGVGHRIVGNDLSNGGVGHKIGVFGDTSVIRILGNRLDSNGTLGTKYYCIYVQGFGINSDIEVGWNEMRNQYGRSMQVFGHLAGDRVEDLRIHDNVMVGAELNNLILGGSDGGTEILGTVTVTGNVIAGATAEGLRVNDPQGTVVIENNTLVGNAFAQVYLERAGVGLITLRDNIVVAQAGQQYYQFDAGSSPASFLPANNLVFGAGPCDPWDTGCINQDPLFVGPSDYHLQPGSPAIDAGVATPVARDHDGIPRPQGAAYDIGAYESPMAAAQPSISIGDAALLEGDAGPQNAVFAVTLSAASGSGVSVAFATADGSATAGSDYTASSGTLSFAPGSTSGSVSVPLLGDTVPEADETFQVDLSAPNGATLGDAQGGGLIVNDDPPALAIPIELSHGAALRLDLRADPGPTPDLDLFRIRQQPRSSYEVVMDETSADLGGPPNPVLLERVAADLSTVLQASTPIGQGASRSLRWEQPLAAMHDTEVVRVSGAACGASCDPADVYRLRVFETTCFIPRFNNSATQITLMVLENGAAQALAGTLWFWGPAGSLVGSQAFAIPGQGTLTLNTATVPGAGGTSGSVTISHSGRYGDLSGKAVSVEPATGFTFDTPMALRPR